MIGDTRSVGFAHQILKMVGTSRPTLFCCPLIVLFFFAGCGATQLAAGNRHLLAALQTAVTSKNEQWLDAVAKHVEEQHTKRAMSDAEYKAFDAVIQSAKKGEWDAARDRVFALSEGQRPTPEDVARARTPKKASGRR